jgi:hypothetical protein
MKTPSFCIVLLALFSVGAALGAANPTRSGYIEVPDGKLYYETEGWCFHFHHCFQEEVFTG